MIEKNVKSSKRNADVISELVLALLLKLSLIKRLTIVSAEKIQ